MNTVKITPQKSAQLNAEAMKRMRWRLWFAFAESKYNHFCKDGDKKKPHYQNIDAYCSEHWGKTIGNMTKEELAKHISQVTKWK